MSAAGTTTTSATVHQAQHDAAAAADRARIEVRDLAPRDTAAAGALLTSIWGSSAVEPPLMVALSHSGAYVAGAFAGDEMVGACVGYFAEPLGQALHSHVAGVAPGTGRRGIGVAMKLHQRAWALARGLTRITWTFDPLVSRNASFNLTGLGVDIEDYLVDFYGEMSDGVNAGQGSDRLLASWRLDTAWPPPQRSAPAPDAPQDQDQDQGEAPLHGAPRASAVLAVTEEGAPRPQVPRPDAGLLTVAVPDDIETLRAQDPALAARWRGAVRGAMVPLLERGHTVHGFHDHRYLLGRP